ncbi:substrate-binding domain-containing protein [Sphingobacterium sp. E70]|uniref:PstS family phosphate ABC transporter substrate-binding protein n=1 Tax=Sphingobacterium sp. E70 TaxID=2853439 RepID=UPI00211B9605|nr:substrate-binding domain-containing protein [Sphingobacterium sp. E70]ULT25302.1 substrate-binding domain-containing protein [Sphingobacterium sp. E70]
MLTGMVDIGLVSRDLHAQEVKKGAVPIIVAKDAVICTLNPGNPNYKALLKRGLTREELADIFVNRKFKTWNQIDPQFTADPINVYVRSDAAGAAETWAKFLDTNRRICKVLASSETLASPKRLKMISLALASTTLIMYII